MNVSISIKNSNPVDAAKAEELSRLFGLDDKIVELLISRGINTADALKKFLYPDKSMFYDPFKMKGMREATDRIRKAIDNKEKVIIYGDYDADGVCAAAVLSLFLSSEGLDVFVHIPNRISDGYGLNEETLEKIIETHTPDLIVTCDCGISGVEEVRFALDLGVDVIVTDHHEVSGLVPECIVVNPKQEDCDYPFDMLCGAGVAIKVIQALGGLDKMLEYTDLACVATIADLVPLTDENRLIVQLGLKKINDKKNLGLTFLFDALGLENVSSGDVAYKVAPRINAAGRMGDAYRAFELLTTVDVKRAKQIVDEIEEDNLRRKEMCDEMYSEAVEDLNSEDLINNRAIILSHPSWEKGITGILAARLAGEYNRPVFILVKSGDTYKGTCRSIDGINVHELLVGCRDSLVEFGGHAQAAGFSIAPEKIDEFRKSVNDYLKAFPDDLFMPKAYYDAEITPKEVNYEFVKSLELLEPFGNGNNKPLFKMELDNLKIAPCKSNQSHISIMSDSGLQIFAFNYSKLSYQLMSQGKKVIVTELQTSNYGGKQIKGIMKCCAPSSLYINEAACEGFKYNLLKYVPQSKCDYSVYDEQYLNKISGNLYGTLIIAPDKDSYNEFVEKHELPFFKEFMYATSRNNYSRIIVAPSFEQGNICFANYDHIVFLRAPLNSGIISYLNSVTKAQILLPEKCSENYEVSVDRKIFADYFESMKKLQNLSFSGFNAYFRQLIKNKPDCKMSQFMFCLDVFEELGFVTVENNPYRILFNSGKRADLNTSAIYTLIKEKIEE